MRKLILGSIFLVFGAEAMASAGVYKGNLVTELCQWASDYTSADDAHCEQIIPRAERMKQCSVQILTTEEKKFLREPVEKKLIHMSMGPNVLRGTVGRPFGYWQNEARNHEVKDLRPGIQAHVVLSYDNQPRSVLMEQTSFGLIFLRHRCENLVMEGT